MLSITARCGKVVLRYPAGRCSRVRLPTIARRLAIVTPRCAIPEQKEPKTEDKKLKVIEQAKNRMIRRGIDQKTAKTILKVWKDNGMTDPAKLKKVLVENSLKNVGVVIIQLMLDAAACGGALLTANVVGVREQFGPVFTLPVQFIMYFLASYFAIGCSFNLTTLGAVGLATWQYNANSEELLTAVKQLAGQPLDVVTKAKGTVNTLKVVQALNQIADILKEKLEAGIPRDDLYRDLCAYITVERSMELYGFDAASFGITEAEAADIATIFNEYDKDDDGVLTLPELEKLCKETFVDLSEAELEETLSLLDKNKDKVIQFHEFVDWWVNKVELPEA